MGFFVYSFVCAFIHSTIHTCRSV